MEEVFLEIPSSGGYKVSNFGNILSKSGKLLKPYFSKKGYLIIDYWFNGIRNSKKVHRLVSSAFLSNPENKPYVNHKNGDKADNRVENLEWCTNLDNMRHAYLTYLNRGRVGGENNNSKIVLDLQTGIFYDCAKDAATAKGMIPSTLYSQLNGKGRNSLMIYV